MSKNILLNCVEPIAAVKFLIKASNVSRTKFFIDAGLNPITGYNFIKKNKTISCKNWYDLIARLPEPFYQMYIKLITRVHKDTKLEGTLSYDPYWFTTKREMSPHSVTDILLYLTDVYSISISEVSYHTRIKIDMVKYYLVEGTHTPRLDRLRLLLSALPYNLVFEFEWMMRNIHSQIPLSDIKYIKAIH
jgi:hypothetical protein